VSSALLPRGKMHEVGRLAFDIARKFGEDLVLEAM
jgi:hypothetical protein